jgi:hypothetical protein
MSVTNKDLDPSTIRKSSTTEVISHCYSCTKVIYIEKKVAAITLRFCNECYKSMTRLIKREKDIWNKL